MAIPIHELSYEYELNHLILQSGGEGTDRKNAMLHFYNTVTGFSNPWTVVASSDAVTAGWPGPGWQTISDLVYSAGAHSWVVYETSHGSQICMEFGSLAYWIKIYFSPDGSFTGGSTTAAPLSGANYRTVIENQSYIFNGSTSRDMRLNVIKATDDGLLLWICVPTYLAFSGWMFVYAEIKDPVPGLDLPYVCHSYQSLISEIPDNASNDAWEETAYWYGYKEAGASSLAIDGHLSGINFDNVRPSDRFTSVNDLTGKHMMWPMNYVSRTTGTRGIHGRIPDIYAVSTSIFNSGDTIEDDTENPAFQWAVFGDYAFPWGGVAPILTL